MDTDTEDPEPAAAASAQPNGAYRENLDQVDRGKRVGDRIYLHVSALPNSLQPITERAAQLAGIESNMFNVVRFSRSADKLSLLDYPALLSEGFPSLRASWAVDLTSGKIESRKYVRSRAPVLHRKELLLPEDHPKIDEFEALTARAESLGLFDDNRIIGMRVTWEEELRARGLRVDGHDLVPAERCDQPAPPEVLRHRTALSRNKLSGPMMALWRHGFLDGQHVLFDYGCGRGDDLSTLAERGVPASGWDPHFRPDGERTPAAVVNLGFVLNVIEDLEERRAALQGAFDLMIDVLAVAALIGGRTAYERHRLYRDGVITSRNTFQKYFTHTELGDYIGDVVGREPVSIAPGIYFVFKTDDREQDFLERRQRSPCSGMVATSIPLPRQRSPRTRKPTRQDRWREHGTKLDALWARCLELARFPSDEEFDGLSELRGVLGTNRRIYSELVDQRGSADLERAQDHRRRDLSVYLALSLFDRRRSFGGLSDRLQLDVRTLWGSYKNAMNDARGLLFAIGNSEQLQAACQIGADAGLGSLRPSGSIEFEAGLLKRMPPILRVYVGCAGKLFGDAEEADWIKLNPVRGTVTFVLCDDFWGLPIPSVIETTRVDLAKQRVRAKDFLSEGRLPSPLLLKGRLLDRSSDACARQIKFDDQISATVVARSRSWLEFDQSLEQLGLQLSGDCLVPQDEKQDRVESTPSPD